jgi:hypothetical protein
VCGPEPGGGSGVITGDPDTYGRVYVGTNGRGLLYGDPSDRNARAGRGHTGLRPPHGLAQGFSLPAATC